MKVCFKCSRALPRTEFYAHPMMGDGLLGKCRGCAKADVRANREKRADYYNAYDRARARKGLKRRLLWSKNNKGMVAASHAVTRAIQKGLMLRQPCSECGDAKSHGHHEDYSKPLEVIWLCQKHHRRRHSELVAMGVDVYKTVPKKL